MEPGASINAPTDSTVILLSFADLVIPTARLAILQLQLAPLVNRVVRIPSSRRVNASVAVIAVSLRSTWFVSHANLLVLLVSQL